MGLAVSAAVATTTVEPTATCEVRATANIAATTTSISADPADITVTHIAAAVTVAMSVVATVIAAVVGVIRVVASVVVVGAGTIPGTGSNEDASYEPVRTVVAIGGTGIRRIAIVAIGAYGGYGVCIGVWISRGRVSLISRNADSDSDRNLCVRLCRRHQHDTEYSQQRNVFEKPHLVTSWAHTSKRVPDTPDPHT